MSDSRSILSDTANGLFSELCGEQDFASIGARLGDAGFPLLLVDEEAGGFGGDWSDAFAVLSAAGAHQLRFPLSEMILARAEIARAGIDAVEGVAGIADSVEGVLKGETFTGVLQRVPWGRNLDYVAATASGRLLVLSVDDSIVEEKLNIAGEPRDALIFTNAPAITAPSEVDLRALGAFVRVAQSAGALNAALDMAIEHVNNRQQFGKPLSKWQTVQQNLAVVAIESAAVSSAGEAAACAMQAGDAVWEIAAAKLRTIVRSG